MRSSGGTPGAHRCSTRSRRRPVRRRPARLRRMRNHRETRREARCGRRAGPHRTHLRPRPRPRPRVTGRRSRSRPPATPSPRRGPATSSPGWIPTSAGRRRSSPDRCSSSPVPGPARPEPSPIASPTSSGITARTRPNASRSPSPGGPPARCASACETCCRTSTIASPSTPSIPSGSPSSGSAGTRPGSNAVSGSHRRRSGNVCSATRSTCPSARHAPISRPSRGHGAPRLRRTRRGTRGQTEVYRAKWRMRTAGGWSSGTGSTSMTSSSGPRTCSSPSRRCARSAGAGTPSSPSTSTRTWTPSRPGSSVTSFLRAATCARSEIRIRRSTASAARTHASLRNSWITTRVPGSCDWLATTVRTGTSSPSPRR